MLMPILKIAELPVLALMLAAVVMPLAKRLARRFGIVSVPYSDSRHQQQKPLMGGLAIIAAILVTLAIGRMLPLWLMVGVAGLFLVGLVDDAIEFSPSRKFLLQIVAVGFVVVTGPAFRLAPWTLVNAALTGFFLISTVNAFNLIDGLDGLAAGVGIIAALSIAGISWLHGDAVGASQALIIAGALGGFLIYNWHPASIFMGDSGALPLGLLLGAMALHAGDLTGDSRLPRYAVPILIMLVPLLDTAIVSVSRMATGKPISRRGQDHSHHRLLSLGLTDQRAVAMAWGLAALGAAFAVVLTWLPHVYMLAALPMIILAFGVVGLFLIDLTFDINSPGVAYDNLRGPARFILTFSYRRRLAEAALDLALIPTAYFGAFLIRLDFKITEPLMHVFIQTLPWLMASTYAAFLIAGVYRGIWRYASVSDVVRFATGSVLAGIFVMIISLIKPLELSGSIAVLYVILLLNLLVASRLSFRAFRWGVALFALPDERVLIVGAGELAEAAARYLTTNRSRRFKLVGFVDDDSFTVGKLVHGRRVLGTMADLDLIYTKKQFSQVLVATETIPGDRMERLWQFASRLQVTVQRFSIRLNDLGPSIESRAAERGAQILPGRPGAKGQVVA
jgi:UDP-GlcNAc:undecaprenyl-phosphate/decaprenyl-phosphate GlcNAc-1-phosphate transferase